MRARIVGVVVERIPCGCAGHDGSRSIVGAAVLDGAIPAERCVVPLVGQGALLPLVGG